MKGTWQRRLIGLYGAATERGLLDTQLGRAAFEWSYGAYKLLFEAGGVHRLRPYVPPGTLAIDIGANVGFFTVRFARWVGPGGAVLAVEPERLNAERLERRVSRRRLAGVVDCVRGVASDVDGRAFLAVNRGHPGDHKIGTTGTEVVAYRVDTLVAQRPAQRVSLVKIDVQGAELLVLRGMNQTLAEHRPALFVEIDEAGLTAFGTSAAEVIDHVYAYGYRGHRFERRLGPAQDADALARSFSTRYGDVLFVPEGTTG